MAAVAKMEMAVIFHRCPSMCRSGRPTESVSITGAQGRTQDFGGGSEDDIQERIQEFRDRSQREGGGLQVEGKAVPAVSWWSGGSDP